MKRINPLKILFASLYFIVIYEFYTFKNTVANISILGPIMIYLFYEALELFDRKLISKVTFIIVGAILKNESASTLTYIVFHWVIIRFGLLYLLFLPLLDDSAAFIATSTLGLFVFIYNSLAFFGVIQAEMEQ
jgi:uncharacterized membrane protein